ncbi:hypothetical protein M0R45_030753 [Rubus argutus]|uniref:Uncharacterized protein n=1 Tax=Rubus argutus TaxID=59490 RepID=A0AAW1WEF2_RUBAR
MKEIEKKKSKIKSTRPVRPLQSTPSITRPQAARFPQPGPVHLIPCRRRLNTQSAPPSSIDAQNPCSFIAAVDPPHDAQSRSLIIPSPPSLLHAVSNQTRRRSIYLKAVIRPEINPSPSRRRAQPASICPWRRTAREPRSVLIRLLLHGTMSSPVPQRCLRQASSLSRRLEKKTVMPSSAPSPPCTHGSRAAFKSVVDPIFVEPVLSCRDLHQASRCISSKPPP